MPFGIDYHNPKLTDDESWDVAVFVNNQPRPHKDQKQDRKNFAQKPIDFPYRPYWDSFSKHQHKCGPFGTIKIDSAPSFP
jgi:thiosulfate dehydrogenase